MDILEFLQTRNSMPRLTDPPPTSDDMAKVYKSALRAPDHAWLRPWKFLQYSNESLKLLSEAFENTAKSLDPHIDKKRLERVKNAPFRAPLVIVLVADIKQHPKVPKIEQMLSLAAAGQNILLSLEFLGYGAIWRTGNMAFNKEIVKELNLEPHQEVIGYIYTGTPQGNKKDLPELDRKNFIEIFD